MYMVGDIYKCQKSSPLKWTDTSCEVIPPALSLSLSLSPLIFPAMMKANQQHHHQKLRAQPPPRPLFSCGFFRHCTQSVLSPTTPKKPNSSSSSSSSSTSAFTSQSFTQWRLPLHHHQPDPPPQPQPQPEPQPVSIPPPVTSLRELFHISELHLSAGSDTEKLRALHLLERAVVPDPPSDPICTPDLMRGLVDCLRTNKAASKHVTKILLALCLAEENRRVAVEAGAAGAVVETAAGMENSAAERALAALELMCTVQEGAAEVRAHALSVPVMVAVMARLAGRGREYAISVLAVVYGGGGDSGEGMPAAPAEEVARAVALALQGECTGRGRRKGAQLLKTLEEYGRSDVIQDDGS